MTYSSETVHYCATLKESDRDSCLGQIAFGSRLTIGVAPAGQLSAGRPAPFCDPGHKIMCMGSLRVPKRENDSELREKTRLQGIPRGSRENDRQLIAVWNCAGFLNQVFGLFAIVRHLLRKVVELIEERMASSSNDPSRNSVLDTSI